MANPFTDFWDFLIGNTNDHNDLGSWKYLFVALFLALIVTSIIIAVRSTMHMIAIMQSAPAQQ